MTSRNTLVTLILFLLPALGCGTARPKDPRADAVEAAILAQHDSFHACYEKNVSEGAKPTGRVTTTFKIQKDGHVTEARVAETTLKAPKVEQCVLTVLSSIRFPADKDVTTVRYPFSFNREANSLVDAITGN